MHKDSKEKRAFIREQRFQRNYDIAEKECPEELKKILREKPYALRHSQKRDKES